MIHTHILTVVAAGLLSTAALLAGDLSQYRQFELNSDLNQVAMQADLQPTQAITVHRRPASIQELTWRAKHGDSVRDIRFSFYDGELFRMIVDYDRNNTRGLTIDDMAVALSATYGDAVGLSGQEIHSPDYDRSKRVTALARWEDSDWSLNLVRFKYESAFSLVALSKKLEAPAQEAIIEALRLDRVEAPQARLDLRKIKEDQRRLEEEASRLVNRPGFRP